MDTGHNERAHVILHRHGLSRHGFCMVPNCIPRGSREKCSVLVRYV